MKYNIIINQLALSELSKDMDVVDAAILDYIITMCRSMNQKVDTRRFIDSNGITWTWMDLRSLLEEMPLLRISSRVALSSRIKKIEENGFVSTLRKRIKGHICLYVKTDRKVDALFVKEGPVSLNVQEEKPVRLNEQSVRINVQETEKPVRETVPIIILTHTDNYIRPLDPFDSFWEVYPNKKAKKAAESVWRRKINPDIAPMIIEDIKKRKVQDDYWLRGFIPLPATYLNGERWTDEITPPRNATPPLPVGTTYTQGKMAGKKEHNF